MLHIRFSWLCALCVSLYGLGSWIVINGLWVELPVLVNFLPEGWNLPAYLSILIQVANIGPLLYVPLTRICRSNGLGICGTCFQPPERMANCIILAVGLMSCILLAHFWDATVRLSGLGTAMHSIGLLTLALCAALVDCTSSVTFVAYLTGLPEAYMGALTFGEAFSDIVPSSIALIQGVGGDPDCVNITVNGTTQTVPQFASPRFSVPVFMYFLALIMGLSLIAFVMLDRMPWGLGHIVHRRYVTSMLIRQSCLPNEPPMASPAISRTRQTDTPTVPIVVVRTDFSPVQPEQTSETLDEETIGVSMPTVPQVKDSTFHSIRSLVLPIALLSYASLLTYGLLPGFQSYSTAPYGATTYHLAATLSGLICALAAVITTYLFHRSKQKHQSMASTRESFVKRSSLLDDLDNTSSCAIQSYLRRLHASWLLLTALFSIPASYVIYLAFTSPDPPQLNGAGPFLAILTWILVRAGFGSLRTWLWLHLSSHSVEPMTLRLAGLATQMGAAIGAVISFLVIVYFRLLTPKHYC